MTRGTKFLGHITQQTKVVVLSEENPVTFRRTLERADLTASEAMKILLRQDVLNVPWPEVVSLARDECARVGAKLLIVDTLGAFVRGGWHTPRGAQAALDPLLAAARSGLGVVAVRHERKSGGTAGDSGVGSIGITAGADVVLALQRPHGYTGPARKIFALSRFEETPAEMSIELREGEYVQLDSAGGGGRGQGRLRVHLRHRVEEDGPA